MELHPYGLEWSNCLLIGKSLGCADIVLLLTIEVISQWMPMHFTHFDLLSPHII